MIMRMKNVIWVWLMLLVTVSAGCAGQPVQRGEIVRHSFSFNRGEFDGQAGVERVQVLDFLYGNPDGYASRPYAEVRQRGECQQGENGVLNMPRKDLKLLYVKWLDKLTGEVREVSLDLRKKLPPDFSDYHRTFFSFKSGQLYVYVITPERRPEGTPPNGPEATAYLRTITIYPEQ